MPLAAGLVALPLLMAAPAVALGEDGPFELPLSTSEISVSQTTATRVDLSALIEDPAEPELDIGTAELEIPETTTPRAASRMALAEDGSRLTITGEGTWSIADEQIVFVPETGADRTTDPIAISIRSQHETRSLPATLRVSIPQSTTQEVRVSAGEETQIDLTAQDPELLPGAQRLELDGLPPGSTLTSDGSRLVVPKEGTWQLSEDRLTLTYSPLGPALGSQPTPVRYSAVDDSGQSTGAGTVTVDVPVIPSRSWSESYGEPIRFELVNGQQNISSKTLALEPLAQDDGAQVGADGTEVTVPGQGRWVLDRETSTVVFTPVDASVTEVASMGVTGGDGQGASAARAILSTGYPRMANLYASAVPGATAEFPLDPRSIVDIPTDSLAFSPQGQPAGADISEDGRQITVPEEGTWEIDVLAGDIRFTPEGDSPDLAVTPVVIEARGVYTGTSGDVANMTSATLSVQYAEELPTLRDDEVLTAPGAPAVVDVLANDTPASAGQPLNPASLQIRSLQAVNPGDLHQWTGSRLEIPGEGVFTIDSDGALTFVPAEGFVGETQEITYLVTDSEGVVSTATVTVEVDPDFDPTAVTSADTAGINTVLRGVLPSSSSTAAVFGSIVALMIFTGGAMLWIGSRMESDRRDWKD